MLPLCAEWTLSRRQGSILADYPKYPLTSGTKPADSERIQSFHLAIAHLRCFDARLTRPDGLVKFNWWDRYNKYIKGVGRVRSYTDLFWAMVYKIALFLGGMKSSSWRQPPRTLNTSGR